MPDTSSRVNLGCFLIALCTACGGLAESAREAEPEAQAPVGSLRAAPEAAAGPDQVEPEPEPEPAGSSQALAEARGVGAACGLAGEAAVNGVIIGDVELRSDPRCGAANSCLLRAPRANPCRPGSTSDVFGCASSDFDDFVAVPPPLVPEPSWQSGVCTCRCDGTPTDLDYCSCPSGMRCEPVIPSAGVNAAARPYVGSYCVL
jgi:hypothetical protein